MSLNFSELTDFTKFIFSRTYNFNEKLLDYNFISTAAQETIDDITYHYPISAEEIFARITSNKNELSTFLYRLGRYAFLKSPEHPLLSYTHWIMREVCGCEIYFSNKINTGLLVIHGIGTIIGSRNTIGKGFKIYQGCTIGHTKDKGKGNILGDNITMYSNSQILGELTIGENVVIGSNTLVLNDIPANSVAKGSPAKFNPIKNK